MCGSCHVSTTTVAMSKQLQLPCLNNCSCHDWITTYDMFKLQLPCLTQKSWSILVNCSCLPRWTMFDMISKLTSAWSQVIMVQPHQQMSRGKLHHCRPSVMQIQRTKLKCHPNFNYHMWHVKVKYLNQENIMHLLCAKALGKCICHGGGGKCHQVNMTISNLWSSGLCVFAICDYLHLPCGLVSRMQVLMLRYWLPRLDNCSCHTRLTVAAMAGQLQLPYLAKCNCPRLASMHVDMQIWITVTMISKLHIPRLLTCNKHTSLSTCSILKHLDLKFLNSMCHPCVGTYNFAL